MAFSRGIGNFGVRGPRSAASAVSWSPLDDGDLAAWLDANQNAYSDAGSTPAGHGDNLYRLVSVNAPAIYGEQATETNRPLYQVGANGMAYWDNDSADNFLAIANSAAIEWADDDPRTYALHVKIDAATNFAMMLSRSGRDEVRLNSTTRRPEFLIAGVTMATDGDEHSTSTWANLVATYDGTTAEFFVDGVSQGTASDPGADDDGGSIYIGQREGSVGSFGFDGKYSQVVISRGVWDATTIALWRNFCQAREPT